MKTIEFNGQQITPEHARKLIAELAEKLAAVDPVMSNSPVGEKMMAILDPRWYAEPAKDVGGSLICMRDPGLGWRAYILPPQSAAELARLITEQAKDAQTIIAGTLMN